MNLCANCNNNVWSTSAVLCESHELQVLGITREMLDSNDGDDVLIDTRQLWDEWKVIQSMREIHFRNMANIFARGRG